MTGRGSILNYLEITARRKPCSSFSLQHGPGITHQLLSKSVVPESSRNKLGFCPSNNFLIKHFYAYLLKQFIAVPIQWPGVVLVGITARSSDLQIIPRQSSGGCSILYKLKKAAIRKKEKNRGRGHKSASLHQPPS